MILLDGFISGCMRIYCTRQECISHSPWLVEYAFLTHAVYSHTTLNVIQYYIIIMHEGHVFNTFVLQIANYSYQFSSF